MAEHDWMIVLNAKNKINATHEARKRRERGENARARSVDGHWVVEVWTDAYGPDHIR
jgi:hypothetical protein